MKTKKKLVIGNWKMNIDAIDEAKKLVRKVKSKTAKITRTEVVFCPPAVYLQALSSGISKKHLLGAQNVAVVSGGSLTGEISATQVKQFGTLYVIVGHSERRKMGETDEMVSKKIRETLNARMHPVVCIGEQIRDENGGHLQFVRNQLGASLAGIGKADISDIVIAYEPVWAIGAKQAMNARDIHEMTLYIKKCLQDMFGSYATTVQVLYGGSVSPLNTEEIVRDGFVDGLLVGRDSLDADAFSDIIKMVDKVK